MSETPQEREISGLENANSPETKEKMETNLEKATRIFAFLKEVEVKGKMVESAIQEGKISEKGKISQYRDIAKNIAEAEKKYFSDKKPLKRYERSVHRDVLNELDKVNEKLTGYNTTMDRLLRGESTVAEAPKEKPQKKEKKQNPPEPAQEVNVVPKTEVRYKTKKSTEGKKSRIEMAGEVEGGEVAVDWAKLGTKLSRLKERVKDPERLKEIDQVLTEIDTFLSEFPHESIEEKEGQKWEEKKELNEKRKVVELKLARLNQRMVLLFEKLGQKIPENLLKYKDFQPTMVSFPQDKVAYGQSEPRERRGLSFAEAEREQEMMREEQKKQGEESAEWSQKLDERKKLFDSFGSAEDLTDEEYEKFDKGLEEYENKEKEGKLRERTPGQERTAGLRKGAGKVSERSTEAKRVKQEAAKKAATESAAPVVEAALEETQVPEESSSVDLDEVENKERANTVELPMDDTAGALGMSDVGGIQEIVAGKNKVEIETGAAVEKKKTKEVKIKSPEKPVESTEVIPDVIKISAGGKTFEFGWHQEVLYTTSKGKKLECIVLGKSKDNNPGLILKDLETGKVFAVSADSLAKRVSIEDREVKPTAVEEENPFAGAGEMVDDDNPFDTNVSPFRKLESDFEQHETGVGQLADIEQDKENFSVLAQEILRKIESIESKLDNNKKVTAKEVYDMMYQMDDEFSNAYGMLLEHPKIKNQPLLEQGQQYKRLYARRNVLVNRLKSMPAETFDFKGLRHLLTGEISDNIIDVEGEEKNSLDIDVQKGETNRSARERVPEISNDLPSVMVNEKEYVQDFLKERVHTKDVSAKKALKMVARIEQEFDTKMRGETMLTKEKEKIGWFRSKQVEREMSGEEQKAQLTKWREEVGNAFDALEKIRISKNEVTPSNEWHKANILLREIEVRLMELEGIPGHKNLEHVILQSNIGLDENRKEIQRRVEEKKDKSGLQNFIGNVRTKLALTAAGAGALAGTSAYMAQYNGERPEARSSMNTEGEGMAQAESTRTQPAITIEETKPVEEVPAAKISKQKTVASQGLAQERKPGMAGEKKTQRETSSPREVRSSVKRNVRNFAREFAQMDEPEYLEGVVRAFKPDHALADEIRKMMGVEETNAKLPGLEKIHVSDSGEFIVGTLENGMEISFLPELVVDQGSTKENPKEHWRLKVADGTPEVPSPEVWSRGDQTIRELRETLSEVAKNYPSIFGSNVEKGKISTDLERAEKKLTQAEALPKNGREFKKQMDEVRKIIDTVRGGVDAAAERIAPQPKEVVDLPQEIFDRFRADVTSLPEAGRLAEEWDKADKALKAAKEARDDVGIEKRTAEVNKVLEQIKNLYTE